MYMVRCCLFTPRCLFKEIIDIHFLRSANGLPPTKTTALPLNDEGATGRGSMVFFNEATTYQTAELQYRTKKEAAEAGENVSRDFGSDANAAFHRNIRFSRPSGSRT